MNNTIFPSTSWYQSLVSMQDCVCVYLCKNITECNNIVRRRLIREYIRQTVENAFRLKKMAIGSVALALAVNHVGDRPLPADYDVVMKMWSWAQTRCKKYGWCQPRSE